MKPQRKLLTILLALLIITTFLGCGDTPESIVLEQIIREVSNFHSPYTGGLIPIGTVNNFDLNVNTPIALEWNGKTLYMLADHGKFERSSQYLFTLDRHTGVAAFVNRNARNLGGSFHGRSFTQVLHVHPRDMTWVTPPDHYIEGIDFPVGYTGEMMAACPVLDSIVFLDIETGLASRMSWLRDFGLTNEDGSPQYAGPRGIAFDGQQLFIGAVRLDSDRKDAELLHIELYKYAKPLSENPLNFSVGEPSVRALCFDQQHLYMSGADTNALYIIDRQTSIAHYVANWHFTTMPEGFTTHRLGDVFNIKSNTYGNIQITGLAYDGADMFGVDAFTNKLYRLERK